MKVREEGFGFLSPVVEILFSHQIITIFNVVKSTLRTLLEIGKLLAQTIRPRLPLMTSTALIILTAINTTTKMKILS
jgi:hypothetical protein